MHGMRRATLQKNLPPSTQAANKHAQVWQEELQSKPRVCVEPCKHTTEQHQLWNKLAPPATPAKTHRRSASD
eukprot:1475330-Amphidinium_carterae.4